MQKIKTNKKTLLILVSSAIIGSFAVFYLVSASNNKEYSPEDKSSESQVEENTSYSEDKTAVEKRQAIDESSNNTEAGNDKKNVEPLISSWGQNPQTKDLNISGYISAIYENGGTCTIKLSKSDKTLEESQTARKDAKVTTCGRMTFGRSELSKGKWTAVLTYESDKAKGSSQSLDIEVE